MNSRRALALAILGLLLACDAVLTTITVEQESTTSVDGATLLEQLVGDLGFGGFLDMDLTQSEALQNQGVADEDIQAIHLVVLELEVLDPAGGDLSFLDSMVFYVEAPGLERKRVAVQDDFPTGTALVEFELVDLDLHDYVVSESMTLTTEVTGHRPDDDTTITARFALDVEVTAQGACNALESTSSS